MPHLSPLGKGRLTGGEPGEWFATKKDPLTRLLRIATEIRRVRIERAKRELAQGERSLAAIAREVGFGNSKRLNEVLHRELGVSPVAFRRQRQLKTST
jgi:AraC-like DNA-binding protein